MDRSLTPQLLLAAYCQGVFPMAHEDGRIYWYDPDPRAIIPLDRFQPSRSLQRTIRQEKFDIRVDTAFTAVMQTCAASAPGREDTWINDDILQAYTRLHRMGFAHSIEAWQAGELVGGLYGVAIQGLFAGESMFSHVRDSSKIALAFLVERLRQRDFCLLDTQFMTDHLQSLGAVEITADEYKRRLSQALLSPTNFG